MVSDQSDRIRKVRYWRVTSATVPGGLWARALGRLMHHEVSVRSQLPTSTVDISRLRPPVPVIFSDPLQVLLYRLAADDAIVVHDLGPIEFPQFYAPGVERLYSAAFRDISDAKPNLVFVSRATQDAFAARYGTDFRSSRVIYNPLRAEALSGSELQPSGVTCPFLLFVGAVGARKNQAGALRAFRLSGLAEVGFQLVICGGPEPGYEEAASEATKTPGSELLGYAKPAELRWLYSHASGFVLTSWLEGFGVPAIEAIQRGLLPILSTDPALREVAGDSAIYVDAGDDASIAAGMREFVDMTTDERSVRLMLAQAHLRSFDTLEIQKAWTGLISEMRHL